MIRHQQKTLRSDIEKGLLHWSTPNFVLPLSPPWSDEPVPTDTCSFVGNDTRLSRNVLPTQILAFPFMSNDPQTPDVALGQIMSAAGQAAGFNCIQLKWSLTEKCFPIVVYGCKRGVKRRETEGTNQKRHSGRVTENRNWGPSN